MPLDTDEVTGLYTQSSLEYEVNKKLVEQPNTIGAMVYFNLDHLKYINKYYGYHIGDSLIKKASEVFQYFKKYGGLVSRIIGDEFAIYLHGFQTTEELFDIIKEVYNYSKGFCLDTEDQASNVIRFSAGISWYPKDAKTFRELCRYADFAMMEAKKIEKGRICTFNKQYYDETSFIFNNSIAINQLIDEKNVRFAFQPIVDLYTGEIFAFEALMRSTMDNFKNPYEILTVATAQSKLSQLESLVAFSVYNELAKNIHIIGDRKIFMNSIPSQVLSFEESNILSDRFKQYFNQMVIEITEQENHNAINMNQKLEFLKTNGIQVAVDDFGNGFSNELRILKLNPNYVKIDMDLIQGIHYDIDKYTIVSNLVKFCHNKNIKLIAEGVEESMDLKIVVELGIDFVQGYYIAKPSFSYGDIPLEIKEEIKSYRINFIE